MNLRSSTKSSGAIDFHKHAALWLIVMLVLYILSGHLTALFLCKLHLPPPRQPQIDCYIYFAAIITAFIARREAMNQYVQDQ
jgi:hypothetical protein